MLPFTPSCGLRRVDLRVNSPAPWLTKVHLLARNLFFRFADETEIEAEQEQNEMNDGPLATDLRCLDRNRPDVWQHNRKRYAGHPQIPTRPRANKECACEKFPHLSVLDRDLESYDSIKNNEDDKPYRQRQDPHR